MAHMFRIAGEDRDTGAPVVLSRHRTLPLLAKRLEAEGAFWSERVEGIFIEHKIYDAWCLLTHSALQDQLKTSSINYTTFKQLRGNVVA